MANDSSVLIRLRLLGAALFSQDAEKSARSLGAVGAGGGKAAAGLDKAAVGGDRATASFRRMHAAALRSRITLDSAGRATGTLITSLRGIGGAVGLTGAFGMYEAAKATVTFDQAMRNVDSIAQLSEGNFAKLEKRVNALAGPTAQAPTTLAQGMYDLVSSGFDANESLVILRSSARAATAGLTDTATSTGAVAAVLNAYHLKARDAARVSDTLFQAVNRGVISFPQLAQTIGDVLPFSASLGVGLRQVGAAVATMTKEGINAPETMTRLKNLMQSFIKPSEGMKNALHKVGAESGEALVKQKGFQGALETVIGATNGSKQAIAKIFPNIRSLGGALALTGKNAKTAHGDLKGFSNVKGLTDQVLAKQSKSLAFQWNKLKATATSLGTTIGLKLIPVATKAIGAISKLTSSRGTVGGFVSGALGQAKPQVHRGPGGRVESVTPLTGAQSAGARVRQIAGNALDAAGGIIRKALPIVKDVVKQVLDAIKPAMPFLRNVLLPLLIGIGKGLLGTVVAAFKVAIPIVRAFATALGFIGRLAAPLRGVIQGIGMVIGVIFTGPILKAISLAGSLGRGFRVIAGAARFARAPIRLVGTVVRGLIGVIGRLVGALGRALTFVSRFAGTLQGGARKVILGATNLVNGVIHTVSTLPGRVGAWIGRMISRITGRLGGAAGRVISAAGRIGRAIIQGIINVIKNAAGEIASAVLSVVPGPVKGIVSKGLHLAGKILPFASGGVVRSPLQIVGERGPELARLPLGTRIYDTRSTRRMLRERPQPVMAAAPAAAGPLFANLRVDLDGRKLHEGVYRVERRRAEAAS